MKHFAKSRRHVSRNDETEKDVAATTTILINDID
jgi:hypothetical protein